MSWTTPRTWVHGEVPTAALLNTHIRDNLRAMVWAYDYEATSSTRTLTTYGDLAATPGQPAITLTTGTRALVFVGCQSSNNTNAQHAIMAYAISGATTKAANDNNMFDHHADGANNVVQSGRMNREEALTAGSNTFTAQYRVTAGTGTFLRRRLLVCAMGPAT